MPLSPDDDTEARAEAGRAVRRLGHALVGHQVPTPLVEEVASTVSELADRLEAGGPPRNRAVESFGSDAWHQQQQHDDGGVVGTYDDRPFSGRSSPWGLDLEVHRHGDEIVGVLELGAAHEGAPGRSHGGIVAALFDDVFGFVLGILQEPAFTGELTVRYVRPTPLHRTPGMPRPAGRTDRPQDLDRGRARRRRDGRGAGPWSRPVHRRRPGGDAAGERPPPRPARRRLRTVSPADSLPHA